jgi:hypothetical protein
MGTQDEEKPKKNKIHYVLEATIHKQIQITEIRQTNGGKDEPNIMFMQKVAL